MSLSACPDCGANLGRNAIKCRCGWASGPQASGGERLTPCAGNPSCKYAGRMWIRSLQPNERICVDHYYIAVQNDGSLAGDPVIPPRMGGLRAKPVAGRE
jgi:hypothetical protein